MLPMSHACSCSRTTLYIHHSQKQRNGIPIKTTAHCTYVAVHQSTPSQALVLPKDNTTYDWAQFRPDADTTHSRSPHALPGELSTDRVGTRLSVFHDMPRCPCSVAIHAPPSPPQVVSLPRGLVPSAAGTGAWEYHRPIMPAPAGDLHRATVPIRPKTCRLLLNTHPRPSQARAAVVAGKTSCWAEFEEKAKAAFASAAFARMRAYLPCLRYAGFPGAGGT